MASAVDETPSDRESRRAHRRERKAKRLERRAEETASDCERRRFRRRERRAQRDAERGTASPVKASITVTSSSLDDDAAPERVPQPSDSQRHRTPDAVQKPKISRRTTDLYSPPITSRPALVKTTHELQDRYYSDNVRDSRQHRHDDRHMREESSHHPRRARDDRYDHEERRHQHHRQTRPRYTDEQRRSHHSDSSDRTYADKEKNRDSYDEDDERTFRRWSWRKKALVIAIPIILIIIIALAAAIAVAKKRSFKYTPSYAQVTNSSAFTNGGASKDANNTDDGIGSGEDKYVYYSGPASKFPQKDEWVSFANMWVSHRNVLLNSCKILEYGKNDSDEEIAHIYNAIQSRASASSVDHRLILAVIIQESHGCVRVPTSENGVRNPGLMQSYNGASFSPYHPAESILQMVQDGTQGTKSGPGLVQHLNTHGNAYSAARMYNSGMIAADGNLSDATGATACYVSDIANRLTGWVHAESKCPSS